MTYTSEFLNVLEQRGFIHQCSNFENLDAALTAGSVTGYIGFDATAQSLHIGNLIQIMRLYWLQQTGHKPIVLMGGGTSKIGDPSFKATERPALTDDAIAANMQAIRTTCFDQFLRFGDGPTDAVMVNNNDWLSELKYLDFLRDYGQHLTVNRMLGFDSVKTRLERESPLTLLEFNYMVMQGYDFLELHRRHGVRLQMGGSDQWGNMINGLELGRRADGAQLFVLTSPLLTTASGAKMGKTADGAVWLSAQMLSPYDYYQYWRNTDDADVGRFLRLFTALDLDEIARLEALKGQEINAAKKVLAFEATKMCHGQEAANSAAKTAQKVFEQDSAGGDLPTITADLGAGVALVDLLIAAGLAESKGAAKRLITGGGARVDDVAIKDIAHVCQGAEQIKLSAGKKKHTIVRAEG